MTGDLRTIPTPRPLPRDAADHWPEPRLGLQYNLLAVPVAGALYPSLLPPPRRRRRDAFSSFSVVPNSLALRGVSPPHR